MNRKALARRLALAGALLSFGLVGHAAADGTILSLSKQGNALYVYDATSFEEIAKYPVGNGPHEVVTDASGRFAYCANYGNQQPGNTVTVIDLRDAKVVTTIDLGELRRPHGLALHDGKLYFTSEVAQAVGRIDLATNKVDWQAKTNQAGTHMLVIQGETGHVWTANIGGGTVSVIDPSAGERAQAKQIEVPGRPEAIAISPDGEHVVVGDNDGGTVTVIDADSHEVIETFAVGTMPIRVGFTPDGKRLLVSDPPAGMLRVFDFEKREKLADVEVGRQPIGFVVNPESNAVLVSVSQDAEIAEVNLESMEVTRRIKTGPVPDGINLAAEDVKPAKQPQGAQEEGAPEQPAAPEGSRMRLGVQVQSAGVPGGLEVMEVFADLAAAKAGLRQGDIILKVNGEQVDDPEAFVDLVYAAPAGQPLKLTIRRNEEEREVEVRLS
jgi:YVTN family beta-propeller protein